MTNDFEKETGKITKALAEVVAKKLVKAQKTVDKEVGKKVDKLRDYRKEASRLASMANKRLQRLEQAGLTDSPAYKKWLESGGEKFSVRGKSHNELQREVARMNQFINSQTSTIRGVNSVLQEMAKNTGIGYKNLTDLRRKASQFFELASKVEQYLRTVDDMASAIGYQKIWTAINQHVKKEKIDLSNSKQDINKLVGEIGRALGEYEKPISINEDGFTAWFKLPKG